MPFQENRNRVYKRQDFNFVLFGGDLLLGRTYFSGMLQVVMSEPPFRDQPYNLKVEAFKKRGMLVYFIQDYFCAEAHGDASVPNTA